MIQEQTNGLPKSAVSSLVATREAIARQLHLTACGCADWHPGDREDTQYDEMATALILSGVVREVGAVEAEQREKDAVIAESHRPEVGTHINVSEYRTGKYDAATIIAAAIRGGEKND